MADHILRFPYAQRVEVWTHLSQLEPLDPSLRADPDRTLREGEVVVTLRITPPQTKVPAGYYTCAHHGTLTNSDTGCCAAAIYHAAAGSVL